MLAHDVEVFEVGDAGGEDRGFESRTAVETPLSVAELLDELLFGLG